MSDINEIPRPKLNYIPKQNMSINSGNTVVFKRYACFAKSVIYIDQNAPIDSAGFRMAPILEVTNEQGE